MIQAFLEFINRDDPLTPDEEAALVALARPMHYEKSEYIYRGNGVANDLFVLTEGMVRAYFAFEDREVNTRLFAAPAFVVAFSSFITQQPSQEMIQCVTGCTGFVFNYHDVINSPIDETRKEFFTRRMAEKHYITMERRLLTLQYKSASERYAYFLEHMEPDIIEKMPSYHIASYLGITPESFSRIKKAVESNKPMASVE